MKTAQRLDRILSNLGYGTRKEIKQAVREGTIKVDGVTVRDSGMHVDPLKNLIEICGEVLSYREFAYIMMNKPVGVISATFDSRLKTVADILPEKYGHFSLFPVGRLDIDTEGLLLMTNDGQLAHALLSPRRHVPKKYYALVEGTVDESDICRFKEGIVLDDGYKTLPAGLDIIRPGKLSEVEVTICEGKYHQVKRMFEAAGKRVKYLKRTGMAGLKLDNSLKAGECRELTDDEVNLLKEAALHTCASG